MHLKSIQRELNAKRRRWWLFVRYELNTLLHCSCGHEGSKAPKLQYKRVNTSLPKIIILIPHQKHRKMRDSRGMGVERGEADVSKKNPMVFIHREWGFVFWGEQISFINFTGAFSPVL